MRVPHTQQWSPPAGGRGGSGNLKETRRALRVSRWAEPPDERDGPGPVLITRAPHMLRWGNLIPRSRSSGIYRCSLSVDNAPELQIGNVCVSGMTLPDTTPGYVRLQQTTCNNSIVLSRLLCLARLVIYRLPLAKV